MASVDNRIVEMEFDNKQFEDGVSKTITSLENLEKSLDISGATKALDTIKDSLNNIDTSGLNDATDTINNRFSVMGTVAVGALERIGAKAVDVGAQILKSLTIQPLIDGFQEYETQMGSIQTIMANTADAFNDPMGTSQEHLDAVNAKLDELNTYADKTIYNFSQMTRNIGTFTAAGVDLDTATASIQGIANLAAVSGSTAQQASTAMYQLSQAIAAGKVSLQDWNSVVNAGMGGKTFQNALVRTARHLGTGVDEALKKYGTFRESLTKGKWLTTEVLTETLKQLTLTVDTTEDYENTVSSLVQQGYTQEEANQIASLAKNSQDAATKVRTFTQLVDTVKEALGSGWTQSWQLIVGDYNEATELLTHVNDVISGIVNQSSEIRNNFLQTWRDLGGREALLQTISTMVQTIAYFVKPITEGLSNLIPTDMAQQLVNLSNFFTDYLSRMDMGWGYAQAIKNIVGTIAELLRNVVGQLLTVAGGVLQGITRVLRGSVALILSIVNNVATLLRTFLQPIYVILNNIAPILATIFDSLGRIAGGALWRIGRTIDQITAGITNLFERIFGGSDIFDRFSSFIATIATNLNGVLVTITDTIMGGMDVLYNVVATAIEKIFTVVGDVIIFVRDTAAPTVIGAIQKAIDVVKNIGSAIGDFFNRAVIQRAADIIDLIVDRTDKLLGKIFNVDDGFGKVSSIISDFIDWLHRLRDTVGDVFTNGLDGLQNFVDFLRNSFTDAIASAKDAVTNIPDQLAPVRDFLQTFFDNVLDFVDNGIFGGIETAIEWVVNRIFDGLEGLVDIFQGSFGQKVVSGIETFGSTARGVFGQVSDVVGNSLTPVVSNFKDVFDNAFQKGIRFISENVVPVFNNLFECAKTVFGGIGLLIADNAVPMFENFKTTAEGVLSDCASTVQTVMGPIVETVGTKASQAFGDFVSVLNSSVKPALETFGENVKTVVGDFVSTIANDAGPALSSFASDASGTIQKFVDSKIIPAMDRVREAVSPILGTARNKISSALSTVADAISTHVIPVLSNLKDSVSNAFGELQRGIQNKALPAFSTFRDNAVSAFSTFVDYINSNVVPAVSNFASGAADAISTFVGDKIIPVLSTFKDTVKDAFGDFNDRIQNIQKGSKDGFSKASDYVQAFGDTISDVFGIAKQKIQPVTDVIKTLGDKAQSVFEEVVGILQRAFQKIHDSIKQFKFDDIPTSLANLAKAILSAFTDDIAPAIVGGGAFAIGKIDEFITDFVSAIGKGFSDKVLPVIQDVIKGIGDVGGGLFGGLLSIFSTKADAKETSDVPAQVENQKTVLETAAEGIGNALKTVRDTLIKYVQGVNWEDINKTITFITDTILDISIAHMVNSLGKINDNIANLAGTLGKAIKNFSGALTAGLKTWQKVLKKLGRVFTAVEILSFATAIKLIADSIKELSDVFAGQDMSNIIPAIGTVVGIFAALVTAMIVIEKFTRENPVAEAISAKNGIEAIVDALKSLGKGVKLASIGVAMIGMAVALRIMAGVFKELQGMNLEQMAPGITAVALALGGLALAVQIMSSHSGDMLKAAGAIGILAGSLWVIVQTIQQVNNMLSANPTGFATSMIIVAAAIAGLCVAMVKVSKSTQNGSGAIKAAAAIAILAGALNLLMPVVKTLAYMPFANAAQGMILAAVGLAAMVGALLAIQKFGGDMKGAVAAAGSLLGVANAIKVFGEAVKVFTELDMDKATEATARLVEGLAVMAVAIGSLANLPTANLLAAGAALIVTSSALYVFSMAVEKLASLDMVNVAASTLVLIGALTAMAGVLTMLGSVALPALLGSLALLGGAAALWVMADGIEKLANSIEKFKDVDDAPQNIGAVLTAINQGFYSSGGIGIDKLLASGALEKTASALTSLAESVETFAAVDPSAADNISNILTAINDGLSSGGALGIDKWFSGGGVEKVANGLSTLAGSVSQYANLDSSVGDNIKMVCQSINDGIGGFGAITDAIAGGGVEKAANGLSKLGGSLQYYQGIDSSVGENIKSVLQGISQGMGGNLLDLITGGLLSGTFESLSNGLTNLAGCLDSYKDIGPAATNISTLLNAIGKNLGGIKALFEGAGAQALPTVADGLSKIAAVLPSYYDMQGAENNIRGLLQAIYEPLTSIKNLFAGGGADAFSAVANGLNTLAPSIQTYAQMDDGAPERISALLDAIKTGLSGYGVVRDSADAIAVAAGSLDTLSNAIPKFASAPVDQVVTNLSLLNDAIWMFTADANDASTMGDALQHLADSCSSFGGNTGSAITGANDLRTALENLKVAISNAASDVKTKFDEIANTIKSKLEEAANIAKDKGKAISNNLVEGISNGQANVVDKATQVVVAALNAFEGHYNQAVQSGRDLSSGLAEGISQGRSKVITSAVTVATAAIDATNETLDEHSPSKVAYRSGMFYDLGLAYGIDDYGTAVAKSSSNLATIATNALTDFVPELNGLLTTNEAVLPVTPVLNLSTIQNGSFLSSIFDSGIKTSLNLQGNVDQNIRDRANIASMFSMLRQDLQLYTDAVMSRPQYSWQMGDATINDDQQIRDDFIALINDLARRADMYRG